jgi:hypothetical protein
MGQSGHLSHRLFDARGGSWLSLEPRQDAYCLWCGSDSTSRFARGDAAHLPVRARGGRPSQTVPRRPFGRRVSRRDSRVVAD